MLPSFAKLSLHTSPQRRHAHTGSASTLDVLQEPEMGEGTDVDPEEEVEEAPDG